MSNYVFNGVVDFAIFCKVNFASLLDEEFHGLAREAAPVPDYSMPVKAYEASQGGCPCNKKKREHAAIIIYKGCAKDTAANPIAVKTLKSLLQLKEEDSITFKEEKNSEPFLTI